jgi:ketosteroid isomerase-like protein
MEKAAAETLFRAALEALQRGDTRPWVEMFADDGVMEFPFGLPGYPPAVEGKARIADYLDDYPDNLAISKIRELVFHHAGDTMIVEFSIEGTAVATGRPYNQAYVSVIYFAGDQIRRYRDYWNPVTAIEALGGVNALVHFGKSGTHGA